MVSDVIPVDQSLKIEQVDNLCYIKEQNKIILQQQEKTFTWLAKIDSRIGHIAQMLESKETLDDEYFLEQIENSEGFESFMSHLETDKKYQRHSVQKMLLF